MTEKSKPSGKPMPGDDRNIIAAEAAATGPTIEERIMAFWQQNRTLLLGIIVVGLAVIAGREGYQYFQASKEADIKAAFGGASTMEARLSFAREHAGHGLAGVALLAVADEAYAKRDFTTAGLHYVAAAAALKEPALAARARLGEAMAALQDGMISKGEPQLAALASDETVPNALRVEAWYHLASAAVAAGDHAKATEYLDKLDALNPAGMWSGRSGGLRARLPAQDRTAAVSLPGS